MNTTAQPQALPRSWDGARVQWGEWFAATAVFVCPPPRAKDRAVCERCKSTAAPAHATGLLDPPAPDDFEALLSLYQSGQLEGSSRPLIWLHAFRCPDCGLDTVWDRRTDEWWTLGPEDYGVDGSHDPRLPIPAAGLSCRTLWHRDPDVCDCPGGMDPDWYYENCEHREGGWLPTWRGSLRPTGRFLVTGSHLALYVDQLGNCDDMPKPELLDRERMRRLAGMLALCPVDQPSEKLFQSAYLDPLEAAGYLIRPLYGAKFAHGVLRDGRVVGVLMPVHPTMDPRVRPVAT
jgi:hypothetical protein